jgi:hypothetical protein
MIDGLTSSLICSLVLAVGYLTVWVVILRSEVKDMKAQRDRYMDMWDESADNRRATEAKLDKAEETISAHRNTLDKMKRLIADMEEWQAEEDDK